MAEAEGWSARQRTAASEFERVLKRGHDHNEDPFANFSYQPVRPTGHFRAFTRRNRYRAIAGIATSREKLGSRAGSNTSLASLSGSTQNLLDPAKMMSMQEDAKSRRISTEVMKHRLYESVITSPRRRRFSMRTDCSGNDPKYYSRMVQSLPVTPAHSENVTPSHSPTTSKRFLYGFFSRGTSPRQMTPEHEAPMDVEEDPSGRGLASIFRPHPRIKRYAVNEEIDMIEELTGGADCRTRTANTLRPDCGLTLGDVPKPTKAKRLEDTSPVHQGHSNILQPNPF